jgi:hypothetical protein
MHKVSLFAPFPTFLQQIWGAKTWCNGRYICVLGEESGGHLSVWQPNKKPQSELTYHSHPAGLSLFPQRKQTYFWYQVTIMQQQDTNGPTGPMYFVFCRLYPVYPPRHCGRVWVLPVISLLLTNTVSVSVSPVRACGPKKKTIVGLLVFNPLCCIGWALVFASEAKTEIDKNFVLLVSFCMFRIEAKQQKSEAKTNGK